MLLSTPSSSQKCGRVCNSGAMAMKKKVPIVLSRFSANEIIKGREQINVLDDDVVISSANETQITEQHSYDEETQINTEVNNVVSSDRDHFIYDSISEEGRDWNAEYAALLRQLDRLGENSNFERSALINFNASSCSEKFVGEDNTRSFLISLSDEDKNDEKILLTEETDEKNKGGSAAKNVLSEVFLVEKNSDFFEEQ